MQILVLNGGIKRGVSWHLKEAFLEPLRAENSITEFYFPQDSPPYCIGCKKCFLVGEHACPHADVVAPIWEAILEADLIVFAYPVYVMRAPAHIKVLLDHLAHRYYIHRPHPRLFTKHALILTQSIGAPNGAAQKDVATSLTWMGISSIKKQGFGLMEGIVWEELSTKRRTKMQAKIHHLSRHYQNCAPASRSLKSKFLFSISRTMRKKILKDEAVPTVDSQYWLDHGWIK